MTARQELLALAGRSGARVLDGVGRVSAGFEQRGLDLQSSDECNDDLDRALRSLPSPAGCTRQAYLELVRPTATSKRHLLVSEGDEPLAVVSVRARGRFREPVTYQCLPGAIAPGRSIPDLGRALGRTGLDIRIEAGLEPEMEALGATMFYPYAVRQIDLTGEYEAYWRSKGLHKNTKRANKRCADMDIRVDADGAIRRVVEQWRGAWADDPSDEVGAAADRERFWTALASEAGEGSLRVVTIELVDGDRTAAGTVSLVDGDRMLLQCFSRDTEYDWHMAGTRAVEATVGWALENGCTVVDFGGGEGYKRWWAPVTTARHGAIFRPRTTEAAHAIGRAGRSAATRIGDSTRSFVADRRAGRNGETSD